MTDWVYQAVVTKIYDGDTITCDIDMGMDVWHRKTSIRLHGINAPEIRGDTREEGLKSRDALVAILPVGSTVSITSHSFEKYGRLLATVWHGDTNINQWMLDNGYAVAYMEG